MAGLTRRGVLTGALALGATTAAGPSAYAAPQPGPKLTRLGDTLLDREALYFVSYDGLVNNESFQLSGILTDAGHQYAAWYTATREAVIARRRLPGGPWRRLTLPHTLSADDSHNVISLGVSPADRRMHVAMDTHNTPVYYTKSEPGRPGRFGPVQRTVDGVDPGGISYPQFVVTPRGRLQLFYRTGGSGNGTNEVAEYQDGTWRALGKWSSATGVYTANGVTSTSRNMYVHGLTYDRRGRLHVFFTWREGNLGVLCAPGGLSNHDTGYVYSDDEARTWRNAAGRVVGATGAAPVGLDAPGTVVDEVGVDRALMNQESQAVDGAGRPHAIVSYVPEDVTSCVTSYAADRAAHARTFHLYAGADGAWHKDRIPVAPQATGRSRLAFDAAGNAYVVMPYGRIVAAAAGNGWRDWTTLFEPGIGAFGEVLIDYARLRDGVLSILYQQASSGTTPSPIRVIDFRLGERT